MKSTARLKTFVEEWNGHNAFAHPFKFDELLQYRDVHGSGIPNGTGNPMGIQ